MVRDESNLPADADERRAASPVICYSVDQLPRYDVAEYARLREDLEAVDEVIVAPRDAATFKVPAGHFFRIYSVEGSQVGDLNLWNADDLTERFFSGKTRQLHASHVTRGDRLWSNMPNLRPMATITHDTLEWYGWDADGAGVHDVIGTRCDPYTNHRLNGVDYHYCCHSNLTRALADARGISLAAAELHVHDVLNVFMCTGFSNDTKQYFMKASPVRPGDFIEFYAEMDLLGALSACPGGNCASEHSSDETQCYPLKVVIYKPTRTKPGHTPGFPASAYSGSHGR
ncbi:MAG: hypothetical protein ACI9LO_002562 [Planctomycetota bacterium]|jgi:uncharacterized protein YcgI (DUF1989 family)